MRSDYPSRRVEKPAALRWYPVRAGASSLHPPLNRGATAFGSTRVHRRADCSKWLWRRALPTNNRGAAIGSAACSVERACEVGRVVSEEREHAVRRDALGGSDFPTGVSLLWARPARCGLTRSTRHLHSTVAAGRRSFEEPFASLRCERFCHDRSRSGSKDGRHRGARGSLLPRRISLSETPPGPPKLRAGRAARCFDPRRSSTPTRGKSPPPTLSANHLA